MPNLKDCLRRAIRESAAAYIGAPIQNPGYRGIEKLRREVLGWFKRSRNIAAELNIFTMLMERGGTGGGLFRRVYRDFLRAAGEHLRDQRLRQGAEDFDRIAQEWSRAAGLISLAGKTRENRHL